MNTENLPIVDTLEALDTSCGDLVMQVFQRMKSMAAGEILEVVTNDEGAPVDLPAWCRQTGHILRQVIQLPEQPARFLIQKKAN